MVPSVIYVDAPCYVTVFAIDPTSVFEISD